MSENTGESLEKPRPGLLIAVCIVLFLGLIIMVGFPDKTPQEKQQEACNDARHAYWVAQDLIAERLKSPKTADFPTFSHVKATPLGDCRHLIKGYVDAQNGFGALIRTRYTVTMAFDRFDSRGDAYYLMETLEFDE
ncbi:MAG TPA: hypothetical protein DCO82_09255 [Alphaproteobacteria bacterium]|nr:hypothetical protein [Alphaproteobacteria bacterium]